MQGHIFYKSGTSGHLKYSQREGLIGYFYILPTFCWVLRKNAPRWTGAGHQAHNEILYPNDSWTASWSESMMFSTRFLSPCKTLYIRRCGRIRNDAPSLEQLGTVHEKDIHKGATIAKFGRLFMMFGLLNAAQTFQKRSTLLTFEDSLSTFERVQCCFHQVSS